MKRVLVLLSTYNGKRFLSEQLDSIYAQKGVVADVLARDDGSSDDTVSILEKYSDANGNLTILKGENVGAKMSFYALASHAFRHMPEYDYYSFCDQDDVWDNDKLIRAVNDLESVQSDFKLWYGNVRLVDAMMNPIPSPPIRMNNDLVSNIVSSHVLGCTEVFTYGLLEKMVRIESVLKPENRLHDYYVPLHDGWLALLAYSMGASVCVSHEACMNYRQHSSNEVGAPRNNLQKVIYRVRRFTERKKQCIKSGKCKTLLAVFEDSEIPSRNLKIISRFAYYKESFAARFRLAFDASIYRYGISTNVGTFFAILFGKF